MKTTIYSVSTTFMILILCLNVSFGQESEITALKKKRIALEAKARSGIEAKVPGGATEALECFPNSVYSQPATNYSNGYTSAEAPGFLVYSDFHGLTSPIGGMVRFWGLRLFYSGSWSQCDTEPMPFEINFYVDNGGVPGPAIYSFTVDGSAVPTGETLAGFPVWQWDVNIPINLNLSDGWISIQSLSSAGDCWFVWINAPDATGAQGYRWNGSTLEPLPTGLGFCLGTDNPVIADVGVGSILSPNTGANLGMEDVTVRVYNYGTAPQTFIPVFYSVNSGTPLYEVISGPIAPGDFIDYTFSVQADLSAYGLYDIEACTNLSGDADPTNDCMVKTVENLPPSLCVPQYSSGCSWGDGFTFFDIDNQVNNASGCDDNTGYDGWSQYLGLPPAVLEPGMTYDFNMSTGYGNNYATVWIDFDDNQEFTPDEKVIDCENMSAPGQVFTFQGTIPAGAAPGQHLLRARTNWVNCADDPCMEYVYGEAEDYYVIISATTGSLEGFVYEFGTSAPVAGALVELAGTPFSAISDNTGLYFIDEIPEGSYDLMVTHPDYCPGDYPGVMITAGNTTFLDLELKWAEIATNPAQEIVVSIPANTTLPTQLEIFNNGNCDLVYDITVTGLTEDNFGGQAPNNELIAVGKQIPQDQWDEYMSELAGEAAPGDVTLTPTINPNPTKPEPNDLEEIFGSDQNSYNAGPRQRGNFFEVTTTTQLAEVRNWLNLPGAMGLVFGVYECPTPEGTYNMIAMADVSPQGPGGPGWYSSGPLSNVILQAGYYYAIIECHEQTANYYNEQNISPYPIPASFGNLFEGFGWNYGGTIEFPPPATLSVSGLSGAPTAYYQTIVTGPPLDWFHLDWYSGTVASGTAVTIPGHFNSTGYPLGTVKTAELIIGSNAHPGKAETVLDVIMIVESCTPIYSTGCSWGDGFELFDIDNQINNATGCDNLNGIGWSQYLSLPPAVLETGATYDFNMITGYSNNYATVWIDFNDDLTFSPDEIIIDCQNMANAGQLYTFQGAIPPAADTGLHMLRARTNWLDCANDPCAQYSYGEAEDYMVHIQDIPAIATLEGYVLETGTGVPVEGATVEILGGSVPWSAVTDITGFYLIPDVPEGNYDLVASHPFYCPQTWTGVDIMEGANFQDFDLAWAEISTDPVQEISAVIPENTTQPTQLGITNNGSCELVYNIEITELTETFGGLSSGNEEVVFTGTPMPLEEFFNLKTFVSKTIHPTDADLDQQGGYNPDPAKYDPSEDEEVFGSTQNSYTAGPRTRGNIFECTMDRKLEEHRFYLDVGSATQMWFLVYEGVSLEGTYSLVSASDVSPQGPGSGWYSSGPVDLALHAGHWYLIVASFEDPCTYFNEQNISPYPIPTSFGHLVEGAGWNFAPSANYPPDPTQNVTGLAGAPVAYYQTLITGPAEPDWFQLDWYSGTAAPGTTVTIPGHFNSTGYPLGTVKTAELNIISNAHPNKTETLLDVVMIVDQGSKLELKAFLEGPFNESTGLMNIWLNAFGFIPLNQPFNPALPYYGNMNPAWLYDGSESVASVPPGVVDWILLELRDAPDAPGAVPSTVFLRMPAFLMNDGSVRGLDGQSLPGFTDPVQQGLFVVIYHRNHLPVMNNLPVTMVGNGLYVWDYSSAEGQVYLGHIGHKELAPGIWGLIGGDGNGDKQVNNADKLEVWSFDAGSSGYLGGDFSMNGMCDNADKNDVWVPNVGLGAQVPNY